MNSDSPLIIDGTEYEPCTECEGDRCADPQYVCIKAVHRCPKCTRKITETSGVELSCSYCGWRERP